MGTKKPKATSTASENMVPPKTLDDSLFFGLQLDAEQKAFRDAIWSTDYDVVICDAASGSGKTTIALATSIMMCEYRRYSAIIYQSAAGVFEYKQGLLPGTLEQKTAPLLAPLYQAVERLGYEPYRIIATNDNMCAYKDGDAMIYAQSDSYIRGTSMGEHGRPVIVILDECQNYALPQLRTSVTRVNEGSKLICIGQQKQCDLKYPQDSGFQRLISLFGTVDWCKICTLSKNYRGRISTLGDEL